LISTWTVGLNIPGYLPESDPLEFEDWADAQQGLLEELAHSYSQVESTLVTIDISYEAARLEVLTAEFDSLVTVSFLGCSYWISKVHSNSTEEVTS
jgi:hypothetical protein